MSPTDEVLSLFPGLNWTLRRRSGGVLEQQQRGFRSFFPFSRVWAFFLFLQTFCRHSEWHCHVHRNTGPILSCFLHPDNVCFWDFQSKTIQPLKAVRPWSIIYAFSWNRHTNILAQTCLVQSLVGVAGGATRAALTVHQARRDNMADISAKDGSQVPHLDDLQSFPQRRHNRSVFFPQCSFNICPPWYGSRGKSRVFS